MNAVVSNKFTDYLVKDLSLADWGRKEMAIAETEMPGLMAIREEYRREPAAEGRAHRRLAAHDHPDRGADRNAAGPGRRGALGVVQHLLHPGPCRRRHCRRWHAGVRLQGRNLDDYWDYTHRIFEWPQDGSERQHDPGRRRRCHPADASGRARRKRSSRCWPSPAAKKKSPVQAAIKTKLQAGPHLVFSRLAKKSTA